MKRLITFFLVISIVYVLTTVCFAGAQTLKVGVVNPLTGGAAAYGARVINAIKIAVDEINGSGGIDMNGEKVLIEIISEDNEGVPSVSVAAMNKLVHRDKVSVAISGAITPVTMADMTVTREAKIPQLSAGASGIMLTQQGNEYIFRVTGSDRNFTSAIIKYLADNFDAEKIGILCEQGDYGEGGAELLTSNAEKLGLEVVAREIYQKGDKDFKAQLSRIKSKGAEALINWGLYSEAARIAIQKEEMDWEVPIFGGSGYSNVILMDLAGDAIEGALFPTSFTNVDPRPEVQEFVKKYEEEFNDTPDLNSGHAYDCIYIIAEAVKRAKSLEPQDLRDAIAATKNFPGISGELTFDETGDCLKETLVVKITSGKHVVVDRVNPY